MKQQKQIALIRWACRKAAMAIEVFHKASLIHDDIEDDDQYRYGQETLHRQHGTGMAINIGDYLIGIGYRLLNEARADIGAEAASDLIEKMAAAHIKLCEGQGAEMAWQESETFELSPLDALQIYALKTSPAFEAALYAGIRMTGSVGQYEALISSFSRHIGVGFQILNDLKDWRDDDHNKLITGQDALAMRPTLLLALALQAADDQQKADSKTFCTAIPQTACELVAYARSIRTATSSPKPKHSLINHEPAPKNCQRASTTKTSNSC